MAVHNQALGRINPELRKNLVAKPRFMDQAEIRVFGLSVCLLIADQIALQGGNPILSKKRRVGAAPKIPEQIQFLWGWSLEQPERDLDRKSTRLNSSHQII